MSHWYDRDGTPRHFIAGADGSSRPATLADARRNGWLPGYSGVDKVIHNHFLQQWITGQAVAVARTLRPMPDEPEKEFVQRINTEASRKASEAAAEGKAIHHAIECHFRSEAVPEPYRPHVQAVLRMLEDNFPSVTDWVSEQTFGHRLGYGGAIDLYSPSAGIFIDYKGADFGPENPDKKLAYSQNRQLAAYRHGMGMERASGCNIFLSRGTPGHAKFHEWTPEELNDGWALFAHALGIWKILNRYDGSW